MEAPISPAPPLWRNPTPALLWLQESILPGPQEKLALVTDSFFLLYSPIYTEMAEQPEVRPLEAEVPIPCADHQLPQTCVAGAVGHTPGGYIVGPFLIHMEEISYVLFLQADAK